MRIILSYVPLAAMLALLAWFLVSSFNSMMAQDAFNLCARDVTASAEVCAQARRAGL